LLHKLFKPGVGSLYFVEYGKVRKLSLSRR